MVSKKSGFCFCAYVGHAIKNLDVNETPAMPTFALCPMKCEWLLLKHRQSLSKGQMFMLVWRTHFYLENMYPYAGFHASTSFLGPTLINNTFLNTGDDGIAIHGRYYLVIAVQTSDPPLHRSFIALLSHRTAAGLSNTFCFPCIALHVEQPSHLSVKLKVW